MNRPLVVVGFSVLLSLSVLWAGGVTLVSYRAWDATRAEIEHKRDTGRRGCAGRYSERDARERCEDLFEVQYVTEFNIALATRALIAVGPLLMLCAVAMIGRRSARR
ncbi:MAG: hypothetical protein NXI18_15560 [Alphaproteobacteria bacterium]|nr:hypothetical protein [Alphaproteobacteria bacterium]